MKVLLVSINSIYEQTGGGIYLRTLKSLYEMSGTKVDIFSKNSPDYKVKKNIFTDLIGRILFCPSYIGAYVFNILIFSKKYDIIAFHSTRLGFLAKIIKFILKNKKIICHSDNVESLLIREVNVNTGILKKILIIIDTFLIPFSESSSVRNCEMISFITEEDKDATEKKLKINLQKKSFIVPVLLDSSPCPNDNSEGYLFFSGSFDFYPNQHALSRIVTLANNNKNLKFCVSGRGLDNFIKEANLTLPENLSIYSDVSSSKMSELYRKAMLYLCPVKYGSGMKTKIAEALSYNLFVITDEDSAYGYKYAIDNRVVFSVNSNLFDDVNSKILQEMVEKVEQIKKNANNKPYQVFNEYYSLKAGIESFRRNIL
ncbi:MULTISPECIES: glycosyltransferase [Enterobacter cloacae complex]|uniref:Glycosyltransferase n=1 Tax=Enterobacter cloacae TaxID=550 RepID=A0A7H8UFG2_ENTCL|nr:MULTISPECIES: glycosyltransferase [Enterobacter cloacae complex]MDE4082918.1 glycosyltransferase [Enterobacter pasteurii]QKZ98533.1 glycosyltransferase [Enterobacter cloacae]